jgi:polyisoprenoid-binding protein YceI
MALPPGTHSLGPGNATLTVQTKRTGAAAKAGHNLAIRVTAWEASIDVGDVTTMALTADGSSMRVESGHGGMQALGDDEKDAITKTIDDEILERREITFRSTSVQDGDGRVAVEGDLILGGDKSQPVTFDLVVGKDRTLKATAVITQSGWGMKPYSILFGSLKVVDEIEVELEGKLEGKLEL